MGLISNGSSVQQWKKIKKFNLENYFNVILISQDVNLAKPEKKIFDLAISECKTENLRNYFIGDDFYNDIKGSYNAGMIPIWFNPEKNRRMNFNGEYYEISNLNMVQTIINKNRT